MSDKQIQVLLIEDNHGDARLMREMLRSDRKAPFNLECADRLSDGLERLSAGGIDVVLLDLSLPDSYGHETVAKVRIRAAGVPIIVLTGLDNEASALAAVRQGAQDYLVKGQIDINLLMHAIRYAIERQRLWMELERRVNELEDALIQIKQLQKLLPICSYCKKIRDEQDNWQKIEYFIAARVGAQFTHHICPHCYETVVKSDLEKLMRPSTK